MLDDSEVTFAGYRIQHPLEPAIQVKVQTRSDNPGPVQAVDSALSTLEKELTIFDKSFRDAMKKAQPPAVAAGRGGMGGGFDDPMNLS